MMTEFVFRRASKADLPAIQHLCIDGVINREPTGSYLGISKETLTGVYDVFSPHINLNLSIVADEITPGHPQGRVVGCILATPFDAQMDERNIDPTYTPILEIVHSLEMWFRENTLRDAGVPSSRVLTAVLAVTEEGYTGKGLLNRMVQSWNTCAVNDGKWDMTVGECTSPFSRRSAVSMGWKEGKVIVYKDFVVNGERPFAGLEGEVVLLHRDLRLLKVPKASL